MSYFSFCFQVLIGIPLIASTNIDCGGRSFHCLNSTHFRICVDLGGGLSTTVDDFVIPCPSLTVCSHNNRFECEFPQSATSSAIADSTTIPPAVPITLPGATNEFDSATTLAWEELTVSTTLPSNTSVGHLELQNDTTVSITESLLTEITTSASVISNEAVTEIIPIPNTTSKPQITTTEDGLVTDTNLRSETESVFDVSIYETTVIPQVTSNATEGNIIITNITENKTNETTQIEVITDNAIDANISTSNVVDSIKETTADPQIEIDTSTALAGNTITLNVSENNINETKTIPEVNVITTTATGINNTITSNITENNIITKTYETSTNINAGSSDTNEANNITSSVIDSIATGTSVTLETPIIKTEGESAVSRVNEMTTNTTPKLTKAAETMNTISVTTMYPEISVHDKASGLIEVSVNQSEIPVQVNRKKATQLISPITTAVPKKMVNTEVSAILNSETLVEEVTATTTAINTDITSIPSVQHNQAFVTESNTYVTTETVKETTIVTPLPEALSDTISNANLLVKGFATQSPIFSVNTESNVHKTTATALHATEIVSNTEDNLILNLKTLNEDNITTAVYNENADKVEGDINTTNVTTSIPGPITMQEIDVVTFNSNNLDGEILVTTTVANVNTESHVAESTGASKTIVTVIPDIVSNFDINSTINLNAPAEDNLISTTVSSFITMSNVTENANVFNVPMTTPYIDTDATFNSNTHIEELTSPTVSKADIINTSASTNTNNVSIISKISPNSVTSTNSEAIKLIDPNNETSTPSSVSEVITTEYKIRENTETFETTKLNNVSALLDSNDGNNTVAIETTKTAVLSVNSIWTTTTDNILEIQTTTSQLDITKSTTESSLDFTTEYPLTFSKSFDKPTTNTKLNNEVTTDNIITVAAVNNNKTTNVNVLTTNTFQKKANTAINNIESGTSTENWILDITDIQLNTTYTTMNESAATDETGTLSTSTKSSVDSFDVISTTENYQVHITTTNDHQLSFETATSNYLPTQLRRDSTGNRFNISEVISLNKTKVSPAIDTNVLQSNNINIKNTTDIITPITEEQYSTTTVFVTEYLTTDTPSTEAQLKKDSSIVIDKEDTSTMPISNAVYIITNQNELPKTVDNAGDSGNTANQGHIPPTMTQVPTESSLIDEETTNIIKTPQPASEVQTPKISSYISTDEESFGTSESIILTTASILESETTGIEIATENNLYNDTTSTERTDEVSITLTSKVTTVAPDAMTSSKTVEVISATQAIQASDDTGVQEETTISTVKDFKSPTISTQLFNVPTTARAPKVFENVQTESSLKNLDLVTTDINFNSAAPSTEGNVISSATLPGNEIPKNIKSRSNDTVISGTNVDNAVLSLGRQINNLTTAITTQNEHLNTTTTKEASAAKINTAIDNIVTSSNARSRTDDLLTQTTTTTEYERNSSLQPLNCINSVQSENGVANQPETKILTQKMTRIVNSAYVTPSVDSPAVQKIQNHEKDLSVTTKILDTKQTNVPIQYITNNVFMTDKREEPTTDTVIGGMFASTALSPTVNAVPGNKDAIIFDKSSPAIVSAGSNTNTDSLSTNVVTWKTTTVQESISSGAVRYINTTKPETISVTEYENEVSILPAMSSTTSADGGREITNVKNPSGNVSLNTHEARENHIAVSVDTTDRPIGTQVSDSIVSQLLSVKDGYFTLQTEKNLQNSTSSMKVTSASNPDVTISVGSNTKPIVLSPNILKITTVQESISSDVRSPTNKDALKIVPLPQNVTQVNILPNVANKPTASTNIGTSMSASVANIISNTTKSLKKVVSNMQDNSAVVNLTISAATETSGIPISTENSSSMIQLPGSLSPTDGFGSGQKYETSIGTTLPNIKDILTPHAEIINVSVLPDRVDTISQLSNISSIAINKHEIKSTINNIGLNQSETNSEYLPNTDISNVPVLISVSTQNTDNVVKEDRNAVKNSEWQPSQESTKNNFDNISLSMQSTSTLSITTSNIEVNVKESTFTNSSLEFHTVVSKTNVNAQPSTHSNTESLPTSVLANDPNLPNNDKANAPVFIVDKQKVNMNRTVNIELSFVPNASHSLTKTSTSSPATIVPKFSNTSTATEANVRKTQTTRKTIDTTNPVVTTGHLSMVNTVNVDVKPTNVERSLNFDCQNRRRGRYSDNTDCRKFYICIGMRQPIEGLCPVNTVFSEIKKQCTKNLSYCVRQNQFKCITNGRFSDFLEHNVYFICVKNRREEFVRFKFQCQSGYKLNKVLVRCEEEEIEPPNKSTSNDSEATKEKISRSKNTDDSNTYDSSNSTNENAKGNVLKTAKDKSSSERKKGNKDFECKEEGKFPDRKSCRRYYVCSKSNRSEGYRQRRKKCDSDEVFHKDKKKCVDADSFECS